MNPFNLKHRPQEETIKRSVLLVLFIIIFSMHVVGQSTSWTGSSNNRWRNASNWTNGVPDANTNVIIGDANFTGSFQPRLRPGRGIGSCLSLTIGNGTKASTLEVDDRLDISGNLTIGANGTLDHSRDREIVILGNWNNSGTYTKSNANYAVYFVGNNQVISGSSVTDFGELYIGSSSYTTLSQDISTSGFISLSGTLDPAQTVQVSGTGYITIGAYGQLVVRAANFTDNYANSGGTFNSSYLAFITYHSNTIAQTISHTIGDDYEILAISGSSTKSPSGNLSINGALLVYNNATLDIENYTVDGSAGDVLAVYAGSTLKIGGTNGFPTNYGSKILATTSTVEYYGGNQTVSAESYGNLIFSTASGSVVKTMPATAMTVAGDFTSYASSGSVSFTAANSIDVEGDINLDANSTFGGSTFAHSLNGDWINNGIYNGCGGSYTFNRANMSISGSGTNNFGDLIIRGNSTTMANNTSAAVCGDFSTSQNGGFTHTAGGTGLFSMTGSSKSITGSNIIFADLAINNSATISTASTFIVAGDMTADGSFTATDGTISFTGSSKSIDGSGAIQFSSLSIPGSVSTNANNSISSNLSVAGSFTATAGTVTFNGQSTLSGTANLFNVSIADSDSLTMGASAQLGIAGTEALGVGSIFNTSDNSPNTVNYNGSGAQSITFDNFSNLTFSNGSTKTATSNLSVNEDLTIGASTTFDGSTHTHTVNGNWINQGSFTASTSTVQFAGAGNSQITGATTFNTLEVNKSSSTEVLLNDDVSTDTLNMTAGQMLTQANEITITATRTGVGTILGTITRTHTFNTGVNYAFEGPNNFVNFSGITSPVTSITMVVSSSAVSGFPSNSSVNRSYDITVNGLAVYTATLRLHYTQAELNGNTENNLTLWNDQGTGTWADQSKTTNDATDNWVELASVNDLSEEWTLAEGQTTYSWVGTVDSSWETANNWSPATVPGAADIVYIGDQVFVNQPTISSSREVKSITFYDTTPSTLTLSTGGVLTVQGNISGEWTSDATHTIDVGAESLNTYGDVVLGEGIANRNINLSLSTGSFTSYGSITQNGSSFTISGNAQVVVKGNYNFLSGSFSQGASTMTYDGTINQTIACLNYYDLNVNKTSGVADIPENVTVSNDFTLSSGQVDVDAKVTVSNNIVIESTAILNMINQDTIMVAGNWVQSGDFNTGLGMVLLNGTSDQQVGPANFNDFNVDKASGSLILTGDISIEGDIKVLNGTAEIGTYDITRTSTGGTASLGANCVLRFSGSGLQVSNFQTLSIAPSSIIEYLGSVNRPIPPITYGNLIISNTGGSKSFLVGATTVVGDLTVSSGATLDASNQTLTLEGDFNMNGSFVNTNGGVVLNGINKELSGNLSFADLTVNGSYDCTSGSIEINGDTEVTSSGDLNFANVNATIHGDLTNAGVLFSSASATFTGTQQQTITLLNAVSSTSTGVVNFNGTVSPIFNSTSSPVFATVNINNTAPIQASQPWYVAVAMNIANGASWDGGPLTHTFAGNFNNQGTVSSSGKMIFAPAFAANVVLGSNFTSTGLVQFDGNMPISLTDNSPVFSSVEISNTHASGISAGSNWTIGQDLTIDSSATFNAASYAHSVAGSWSNNGTFNGMTSTVTFTSTTGTDKISGNGENNFYNLTFDTNAVVSVSNSVAINGDLVNNGQTVDFKESVSFAGNSASVLSGTGSLTFDEMIVNKTGSFVRIDKGATVSSFLELTNGYIDLNGNTLSLSNASPTAIERTSGYILSENSSNTSVLAWNVSSNTSAFIFPFGNSTGDYLPLTFELASGDAGTVSIATYATGNNNLPLPPTVTDINTNGSENSANVVDRYFQIDLSGESNPLVNVTFTASAAEVGTITDLEAQRWNGTSWDAPLAGQSTTATSVTVPNVSQFSPWTISGNGAPLPVTLVSFTASAVNKGVELNWVTATEVNNDYFEIQHAVDEINFKTIAKVDGAGNSEKALSYSYLDKMPNEGANYYRLKQVDFDKTTSYSKPVKVDYNSLPNVSIEIYPNPVVDKLYINSMQNLSDVEMTLYASTGAEIGIDAIKQTISDQRTELNLEHLTSGVYLLELNKGIDKQRVRIVKK
ncbi:T9SS type A sorting domain-containing protein [Fulvivirga sp. RKSG066]|uniref:T9SS type A sorting domain-containing protein n=1 Tax=Fulvivirga aurantia TaxID=2529383 RepID=UPI0012BCE04A|nr:T9SS type A sorting domain-containing protein [Fulvivirga aurantia]MTI21697.1 T9SS type A sorting domain-containing protein [Fulvivirga aurantia]